MEQDRIIPHHHHHHHRPNNYENGDTAIISGSDINASHNYDSSSQHSYSSSEDRHDDYAGHTNGKNDRGGGGSMLGNNNESEDEDSTARAQKDDIPSKDILYNPNLDEEDEAWVYEHRRGGGDNLLEERLRSISRPSSTGTSEDDEASSPLPQNNRNDVKGRVDDDKEDKNIRAIKAPQYGRKQSLTLLKKIKPRTSDAVLSCPCCFEIVCMDCQRHERYTNQFRAMFVMNIGVSWDVTIYPEHCGGKNVDTDKCDSLDASHIEKTENSTSDQKYELGYESTSNTCSDLNTIPVVDDGQSFNNWSARNNGSGDIYYSVHCNKCHTVVAGLNMQDEVYHFFGCLATG